MKITREKYIEILNLAESDLTFKRVAYSFKEFKKRVTNTNIEATVENYKLYDKLCWALVDEACEITNMLYNN